MQQDLEKHLLALQTQLEAAQKRNTELEDALASLSAEQNSQLEQKQAIERLAQRLRGLHQLDRLILSAESLENLAHLALNHVIGLLPCFRASISTVDLNAKTVHILALYTQQESSIVGAQTYPIDDNFISSITNERYTLINDLNLSENARVHQLYTEGIRTIVMIPLRTDDKLIGLLNIHSAQVNAFSQDDIQIALEIGDQIAIGIDGRMLSDAIQRYAQRMEILHAIDLGLIKGGSVKALVSNTFKHLRRIIPCERIGVGVIQHLAQEVIIFTAQFDNESELKDGFRIPIPPNWFDGFDVNGIRLINDLSTMTDMTYKRMFEEGYQSQLQVLLRSGSGNIGVMGLSSKSLNFFTSEYQEIAAEVANQLAIAVNQMQLAEAMEHYAAELEQRVVERTAELQMSKDQIEVILHNSLDGILLIDRELKIVRANHAVSRWLPFELEHESVVNLLELAQPEDADRIKTNIEKVFAEQEALPIEIQTEQRDGKKVAVELTFGAVPGDGLVSTIHDVTARKQTEEALKAALSQQKELVDAKSRFVSVTSHEFRTPLSIILSSADILLNYRERLNTEKIDQKLNIIRQNVMYMTEVMDDVLQLARLQSQNVELQFQLNDLDALCRSIIEEFELLPHTQGRLNYSGNISPIATLFDQRMMRLVINNLISNAIKYSPPDSLVEINLVYDTKQVTLSIKDHGIGIPASDLAQLFEPFHRASNVGEIQGTGLGLSITKQIIERHGGQLKVESQLDQGSIFTIYLPINLN